MKRIQMQEKGRGVRGVRWRNDVERGECESGGGEREKRDTEKREG